MSVGLPDLWRLWVDRFSTRDVGTWLSGGLRGREGRGRGRGREGGGEGGGFFVSSNTRT